MRGLDSAAVDVDVDLVEVFGFGGSGAWVSRGRKGILGRIYGEGFYLTESLWGRGGSDY